MARKNKTKKKEKKFDIIIVLLICMAIALLYMGYKEIKPVLDSKSLMSDLLKSSVEDAKDPLNRKIDFDKLKETNEDIVGWLYIPGTSVDYPILLGDSNDEYLYRDIEGNWTGLGSIFALKNTEEDLSNARICLFGHNMLYYEMFGELKRYYQEDKFRDKHQTFYVYTPDRVMELGIYSILTCHESDDLISNHHYFGDDD